MNKEEGKFFEYADQWHYKQLLQELYRNCILTFHNFDFFLPDVDKLYAAITNFPNLSLKDIIDKKLVKILDEYNEHKQKIIKDWERDRYNMMPLHSKSALSQALDSAKLWYYRNKFYIIRDTLGYHGAFTHTKEPPEQGNQI